MQLEILTPEKKLFSGQATSVILPGVDGSFQLLEKHAPIISALKTGKLEFKTGSETKTLDIAGGFVECQNNKVIVLVEGAIS